MIQIIIIVTSISSLAKDFKICNFQIQFPPPFNWQFGIKFKQLSRNEKIFLESYYDYWIFEAIDGDKKRVGEDTALRAQETDDCIIEA